MAAGVTATGSDKAVLREDPIRLAAVDSLTVSCGRRWCMLIPGPLTVRRPVNNEISIRVSRHICQEVCPWNERFAEVGGEAAYSPRSELAGPSLVELAERLLGMSGKGFLREFSGSPVTRARRKGLLRNVCVALGNWGVEEASYARLCALRHCSHRAWACCLGAWPGGVTCCARRALLSIGGRGRSVRAQ